MKTEMLIDCLEEINRMVYRQWCDETYCEALDKAISVVKKTIPQKVTHEATLYERCTCPNCKSRVDEFVDFLGDKVRIPVKYCKFCGQALDWSEE